MGVVFFDMDGVWFLCELGMGDLFDGVSCGVVSFLFFNNIVIGFVLNFKVGYCWYFIGRLFIWWVILIFFNY